MSDFILEQLDEDEDDEPGDLSVCHHGVGFDGECADCDEEIEAECIDE